MTSRACVGMLPLLLVAGCAVVHRAHSPDPTLRDSAATSPRPVPSAPGLGFLNPLEMPRPEIERRSHALTQEQLQRTHLFVVNGLDPLYWSNLNGTVEYLRSIGFKNAHCVQLYEAGSFRGDIAEVRKKDPGGRIVLLGYSSGANGARALANQLAGDHVELDLLVYLGGDTIFNTPDSKPGNAKRILNIMGNGLVLTGYNLFFKGEEIDGASNHRVNCRHIVLPARRQTVELLVTHLTELWVDDRPFLHVELGRPEPLAP